MISIIVCTYNRDKYIYNVLKSNNSTDDTEKECIRFQSDYPEVKFRYFLETAQGLSFARNRGIKESRGEILLFLDDDSFVQKDYLVNLVRNLEDYPDADAFGGKITPLFESGVTPEWLAKWNKSWISAIDLGNRVKLFKKGKYPIGANMGIRRSCLEAVGDFNTKLGRSRKNLMGGEEKDIFNRIRNQGGKIYYFPDVEVQHIIPPSRTTKEFICKMGEGIGMSERIRTLDISRWSYMKRLFMELVKWGGTLVLWLGFALKGQFKKGNMLVVFRKMVTKGLLTRSC